MSAAPLHGVADYPVGAPTIVCRRPGNASERAAHFAIRHRVFVEEQSLFGGSDRDSHDEDAAVIALVGYCDGVPAGTVRLYELDAAAGLWQGDRLAVLEPYRVRGLGAPLVRCAVATAGSQGGQTMIAHIQMQNVSFFRRIGWSSVGEIEIYAGRPHQLMSIALPTVEEAAGIVRRLAEGISARDR